jgi:hypothetical protein
MTDEELLIKIEEITKGYSGQIDDLYCVVGMIVIGRLLGWRVMRLVCPRRTWSNAIKLFGDPKLIMDERGKYAHKSVGLKLVDKIGDYWEVIKGHKSISSAERKLAE